MTRKSKSRKRKFGSTTNDTEDSSEEIDEEGVRKLKLKLKKIQLEEQIKNKEAEIKETEEAEQKEKKAKEDAKAKYEGAIQNFKDRIFKKKDNNITNENEVKGYAAAKIQGFFRKSKKLQLKKQQDFLIDLEKDFPQSKESSISFPNIDKVNKKLSDLFDYIGKYTMEESEETKELEKQQIEAEIELAKAEAKQAIRESERKFGVWRSDIENSTGRKEEEYDDDDDDDDDDNDDDDDFEVRTKETFKNNDDYKNKYSNNVEVLEWNIEDLEAILNDSENLQEKFTIQDLEKISANMEEKYNDEDNESDNLQSRIKQYIKEQEGNKIENVFLYTIYTNLGLLKSDEKKVAKLIDDNNNYISYSRQNIAKASGNIERIKKQLGSSEKAINSYIGNIFQILKPNIVQIKKFDEGITATSTKLNEKQEGTDFEKYTDGDINQCCEKDGEKDGENDGDTKELLQKLKKYNNIKQEEEKRKLLYELLEIDNLGKTFSDKISKIELGELEEKVFKKEGLKTQIIKLIENNITNDTDYEKVLEKIEGVLRNKFKEMTKSKLERIKKIEEKIKEINENINSAEKDLEQLEINLTTIKEKIKANNERIQEATKQANIYKNQKEIIKKYKEFYGLNEEAKEPEIKEAMEKKYNTIIEDVKDKTNVISKKFKALWYGQPLDATIKNKCSEKFKNLIDNDVNFKTFEMKNFIEFHEQVFGIYLEYYPVKNVINLATYGSGWGEEQQNAAKANLEKIQKGTQLGDLIQTVKLGENSESYGPFYKVLHTSSEEPKELYYNVKEDFNRLTKSDSDIDHIIYAGYGFSGSGKTYTLVEKDNPNSILNQIEKLLKQKEKEKEITLEIKTYSRYAEIYDGDCNNAIDDYYQDKNNLIKIKEEFESYKGGLISDYIEQINKKRKQTTIGENGNLFRTSIRKTPNNVESSRSHLFIDIILNVNGKNKIITLLDMAGNEDASVIQKDYFESFPGYKVEYEELGTKIETLKICISQIKAKPDPPAKPMIWKEWKKKAGSGYPALVKAYHALAKGGIVKTGYIRNIIKQEGQSYKINIKKWEELFDDIAGKNGPGESYLPQKTERDSFIKNYNYYQMLEIILVIKKINEALKLLEEGKDKTTKFCNLGEKLTCANQTREPKTMCYNFHKFKKGKFKKSINNFFREILNNNSEISNFNQIENYYDADNYGLCGSYNGNNAANTLHKPFLSAIYDLYTQINKLVVIGEKEASRGSQEKINVIKHIKNYEKEYERYKKEKDTKEFWDKIEGYVAKKKEWDQGIIGKYHCPLRFQGNAINDSIDNLKRNLQEINNTKNTTYTSGTFPFDVWEEQKHHSGKYTRKNYVIFTNVRLDLSHSVSIGEAYDTSLKFSQELVSDTTTFTKEKVKKTKKVKRRRKMGRKVSKKTSTRSFRKRGRRRGPSETEIL